MTANATEQVGTGFIWSRVGVVVAALLVGVCWLIVGASPRSLPMTISCAIAVFVLYYVVPMATGPIMFANSSVIAPFYIIVLYTAVVRQDVAGELLAGGTIAHLAVFATFSDRMSYRRRRRMLAESLSLLAIYLGAVFGVAKWTDSNLAPLVGVGIALVVTAMFQAVAYDDPLSEVVPNVTVNLPYELGLAAIGLSVAQWWATDPAVVAAMVAFVAFLIVRAAGSAVREHSAGVLADTNTALAAAQSRAEVDAALRACLVEVTMSRPSAVLTVPGRHLHEPSAVGTTLSKHRRTPDWGAGVLPARAGAMVFVPFDDCTMVAINTPFQNRISTPATLAALVSATTAAEQVIERIAASADLAEANRRAHTDMLTGLANRAGWYHHLAVRRGIGVIVFLDVDHLKNVNDEFGHERGDALLRDVATRLAAVTGPDALAARFAGDEFAAWLPGCGPDEIARIEQQLTNAFAALDFRGDNWQAGVSFGSVFVGAGDDLDEKCAEADVSMYHRKRARKAARA